MLQNKSLNVKYYFVIVENLQKSSIWLKHLSIGL